MTEKELEIKNKCEKDILFFITQCKYKTESFVLRSYQENVIEQINNHKYNVGLISRQVGLTTIAAFLIVHDLCFGNNKTTFLVATKKECAAEILNKVKMILMGLPFYLRPDFNESNECITTNNGKFICTATFKLINTINTIDFLIIDDATWADIKKVEDKLKDKLTSETKYLYYSSYDGSENNQFYKLYKDAVKGINLFKPFTIHYTAVPGRDDNWKYNMIKMLGGKELGFKKFAHQYDLEF